MHAQRVAEIVAYANTRRCRHGHINAYLGGRTITHCTSCDNCQPPAPQETDRGLPDESAQLQAILQVAAHGWGRHTLAMILRGEAKAPPSATNTPGFGALPFRSEGALGKMIDLLQQRGFLQARQLEHGGFMLQLTAVGHHALRDPSGLRALAKPPVKPAPPEVIPKHKEHAADVPADVSSVTDDDPLFERLRAWRSEKARQERVPSYFVAHVSLLRNIAAARPRNENELRAIKGMGPRKFEQYGAELLALVKETASG